MACYLRPLWGTCSLECEAGDGSERTGGQLYHAVVRNLGALGIPPNDVLIVLQEPAMENWGIRGGMPASEVDLGFTPMPEARQ